MAFRVDWRHACSLVSVFCLLRAAGTVVWRLRWHVQRQLREGTRDRTRVRAMCLCPCPCPFLFRLLPSSAILVSLAVWSICSSSTRCAAYCYRKRVSSLLRFSLVALSFSGVGRGRAQLCAHILQRRKVWLACLERRLRARMSHLNGASGCAPVYAAWTLSWLAPPPS